MDGETQQTMDGEEGGGNRERALLSIADDRQKCAGDGGEQAGAQ